MRIKQALSSTVRQPRRERLGARILAHRRTSQPQGTGDPEQGLPAGMPAADLVVDSLPSHPALCARFQFRRAAGEGTVAPGGTNGRAREEWKVPQPGMGPLEPAFDGLPHVGEQVPSIGDLLRLGTAEACTSGILRRAIPSDEFDAGMPFEPAGNRGCRAIGEEVDDAVTIVPYRLSFRIAQSSIPTRMGAGASGIGMRVTSRSTVARLAGMWRCVRRRAPPAPPQARPTLACASPSRRVRRARGARRVMGVSAKVRRRQVGLRQ
ncbi:hypothetical protein Maq22A_2p40860 (plasmid) [Methylobacterium aquaticum]|uniref:Uncharacterized protein n=2 Tax=Methylobacterium TaxID=407 RepID=A0A0C6FNN2_9HYPH|nr:hypothetical protein Maq22A_2p40860 [Methylobacterium aquaticum]